MRRGPNRKLAMSPYWRATFRKKSMRWALKSPRLPPMSVPFGPGGRAFDGMRRLRFVGQASGLPKLRQAGSLPHQQSARERLLPLAAEFLDRQPGQFLPRLRLVLPLAHDRVQLADDLRVVLLGD